MKRNVMLGMAMMLAAQTQAHYLWLEKGADNQARLYFGEWHAGRIEGAEKLQRFVDAQFLLPNGKRSAGELKENYLQSKAANKGDMRMVLDSLPAKENREKQLTQTEYYAKVGREQTQAAMKFELVPVQANGNSWQLLFDGQPLPRAEVVVFGPPKWEKNLRTDKEGNLSFETPWAGQYVIEIEHNIAAEAETTADTPNRRYVYTGSFVVAEGIAWAQ